MRSSEPGESGSSEARIRLFVALELPAPVRDALVAWRARVAPPGLRLVAPEALHVTLCFLGWQRQDAVEGIAGACVAVGDEPALTLAPGAAVWLPPRRPRVLAVELADGEGRLADLQQRLSEALARGGWYEPEQRRYLAHVTVARVPARGPAVGRRPPGLDAPPRLEFRAARLVLFRSRLSSGGARYDALAAVELGG